MKSAILRHVHVLMIAALFLAALGGASAVESVHASGSSQIAKAPPALPDADLALSIHPLERVMIGEDFEFSLAFDTSADTGYGPFVDLILPVNGIDGAAGTDTPDGIDFVSAVYDGYTLTATTLVFPDDDGPLNPGTTGCVSHPFAVEDTGNAAQVCGTTGDELVVLELPFSSITQDMPTLYIEVTAHVSNLADVNTPLTILGRGGYRFGADNLNNPVADPAILTPTSTDGSGWPSLQVTPRVIHIEKEFVGPSECPYNLPAGPAFKKDCYGDVHPVYESVSGPNFPRQYNIDVYVAAGQTVTDLDVTDIFPNNLAYLSVASLGGGTLVDSPTVGTAANAPDNDLVVNFASLTGSTTIVVDFFIPEFDADGNPVLNPATGASAVAENIASALGNWTPVDTRDNATPGNAVANGPCPGSCTPLHTLDIRSIAVQKSITIETDNGAAGYTPGDVLKYTLEFQISDYFTVGDLVLTDVLTDGQRFDDSGTNTPIFSVSDRNTTLTDIDFTYTPPPGSPTPADDLTIDESQIGNTGVPADGTDGNTTLTFDISKAMLNAGAVDGILQGGEAGATGGTPAIGTITYYAVIQEDFSDTYPSGDSSVDHGDVMFNSVTIEASIRDENTIATTLGTQTNDSVEKIKIVYDDFEKDIYAVNGSTSFTPFVQPGDTITFRLRHSLPSSDSDFLVLTDFLPMPIFDAGEVTTFDDVTDATVPVAGHAKFGPNSTLNAALAVPVLPTLSVDAAANSLSFDFGSFDDPTDTTTEIDILFTLTVSNDPYMDGAVLTNLALGLEDTTNNGQLFHSGTKQFTLKEPGLSVRKGVVASDNPAAIFLPNPTGPVTFSAPGSNPSWSGVIASGDNDPNTGLINSNVANTKTGDLLTFAIVLENLGSSSLGAFDISVKDSLPTDLDIPSGGINLQVRRGDGTAVTFAPVGSTTTDPSGLFDDGIILTDESPTQGIAHVYDPANGQNLIVITYDLQIAAGVAPGTSIVNTATLLSYAGTEGGPNHVGTAPTNNVHSDDASTTLLVGLTVTVNQAASQTDPTSTLPVQFTVIFSKPINTSTFTPGDITLGGSAGATTAVITQIAPNDDTTFNVDVSGVANIGTIIASIPANAVQDSIGNDNAASTSNDNSVTYSSTFVDVPFNHWAWKYVESIHKAGITKGCLTNPLSYCPGQSVTRAQMAVFILKGIHGGNYTPPAATGNVFNDVPASHWAAAWIEQLYAEGITVGCSIGSYCPDQTETTRAQMAVFLLKVKYGPSYTPPAVGASTGFNDVPVDYWAAAWIKQLVAESLTGGCGGGNYCPGDPVTRDQMAVFIQRIFGLPLP
ncbi:MAG: S-layer homology domain-containing protein [Anaerolineales bacterium]|nr:S-layer homology domain-containing protein [Anaerolineales bacterium]